MLEWRRGDVGKWGVKRNLGFDDGNDHLLQIVRRDMPLSATAAAAGTRVLAADARAKDVHGCRLSGKVDGLLVHRVDTARQLREVVGGGIARLLDISGSCNCCAIFVLILIEGVAALTAKGFSVPESPAEVL